MRILFHQVVDVGRTNILEYILQGLEPYTEYSIQLAARFGLDEKNWSEWTPVETVYTRQTCEYDCQNKRLFQNSELE